MTPEIEEIQRVVAERFGIPIEEFRGRGRRANTALARQVAMALAIELRHAPAAEVGHAFGRDHGTVTHAIRVVASRVSWDLSFKQIVADCRRALNATEGLDIAEMAVTRESLRVARITVTAEALEREVTDLTARYIVPELRATTRDRLAKLGRQCQAAAEEIAALTFR